MSLFGTSTLFIQHNLLARRKGSKNEEASWVLFCSPPIHFEAQKCKPSGKIKGKKPTKDKCNTDDGAECCKEGKFYTTYKCSPSVSGRTKTTLTINNFEKGRDGGAPSEGVTKASQSMQMGGVWVVDECDSTMGCDSDHAYQPPCNNNIVDASEAVWRALGVPKKDWGGMEIFWSD
ncbi:hypothetical protein CsSME_00044980 [Camellia sinensis var. sinensis]